MSQKSDLNPHKNVRFEIKQLYYQEKNRAKDVK